MPLAFDGTLLIVVVTLLEMSLGVSLPAGHCANREHRQTLALFEFRDQQIEQLRDKADCSRIQLSELPTVSSPLGNRLWPPVRT
jgi:hypothetical protein